MDFLSKFKSFLGIPQEPLRSDAPRDAPDEGQFYTENTPDQPPQFRKFNMFTDPVEIHRYFEQQMSEMLRNFGFPEFRGSEDFGSQTFGFPQIEDSPQDYKQHPEELRDHFLKPGYDKTIKDPDKKQDQDIDGKVVMGDLGTILGRNNYTEIPPKAHFFGQSVTSKTVRNSDGSLEIHRTVRDNQGNEEITITRKVGDKEYSLVTKRDKNGKEETVENFVNLDESEAGKLFPPKLDDAGPSSGPSMYDKFFK